MSTMGADIDDRKLSIRRSILIRATPARVWREFETFEEGTPWDAPTYVAVQLMPNAYGTLVEILHYGFERIGESAVAQFSDFEGGWDLRELRQLKDVVEAA